MPQFNKKIRIFWLRISLFSFLLSGCIEKSSAPKILLSSEELFKHECSANVIDIVANKEQNKIVISMNGALFEQFLNESEFQTAISTLDTFQHPLIAQCGDVGTRIVFLPAPNS